MADDMATIFPTEMASTTKVIEESTGAPGPAQPPPAPQLDRGQCDNHPDRPATAMTTFRTVAVQRFCASCLPPHYQPYVK